MIWAITSYFNPMRYQRRLRAFRMFRSALNIPLVAVELGYQGCFDLKSDDADIVIRITGRDVMWQKECLLNIAVNALPGDCDIVAWLDCDILFDVEDWHEQLVDELRTNPLAQLFREVHYLGPDWNAGENPATAVERSRRSLVSGITPEMPVADCMAHPSKNQRPGTYANGMAWAAKRDFLAEHRFYDACIIGGGDRAISCAAYGCYQHLFDWHEFNPRQRDHYLSWAEPFHASCRGRVAGLEGSIYHQWHGKAVNRGLGSRHGGLCQFEFDPFRDIKYDEQGCWVWNSDKTEMHTYVEQYFATRREDG